MDLPSKGVTLIFIRRAFIPLPITSPPRVQPSKRGGGIVVQNTGKPTISNCTFISNSAVTGGGLYAGDASTPTIIFCKFMGNQAAFGSRMYFQDASQGLVISTLIAGNKGIGAIYNNASSPTLTNCTLAGNGGITGAFLTRMPNPW